LIEAAFEVKQKFIAEGIDCKVLEGGRAITIVHKGPYDNLGQSYKKLVDFTIENKLKLKLPSREVYLKGPGMIFKRNPKKFLTEIQFLIDN